MKKGAQFKEKDNVATCLQQVITGDQLETNWVTVVATEDIPIYHKIALRDLEENESIYKYGEKIGHAITKIAAGSHVHVHNIK